ncbi:hypothetical protein [Actinoplanes sp. G11-F43]|uniref:hypothetical protein n=1 Tax=Actinoplanes sp. G11-F43 TaxID=3424130 RepID=UPI003D34364F
MQLYGIPVSVDQAGSSGIRARVGEQVTLGLSLRCHRREPAGDGDGTGEGIVGFAVAAARESFYGGWVLSAAGVPFHVTEESAKDEVAFIADAKARPGQVVVRVRGQVRVADDRVIEDVRDRWDLDLTRTWTVRRIVRLAGDRPADDFEQATGFLLDLELA